MATALRVGTEREALPSDPTTTTAMLPTVESLEEKETQVSDTTTLQ